MEMTDATAHRKSDASEIEKQTRASRLSARTRAKVCILCCVYYQDWANLSSGRRRDFPMGAQQYQMNDGSIEIEPFFLHSSNFSIL